MTLAIARLNVSGENRSGWLNDAGDPQIVAQFTHISMRTSDRQRQASCLSKF
jgi:hypothetical protein